MAGGVPGALIGGAMGALKARSARKAAARQAESQKHKNIAQIEENKAQRLNAALGSMMNINF